MAFGKIYGVASNPRTQFVQVAAKYEGVDLELVETNPFAGVSAEYKEKFPLGLIPALEVGDFKLTECIAIANYIAAQSNSANLLGSTPEDAASVQQWTSWTNAHVVGNLGPWISQLVGLAPYNKATVESVKTRAFTHLDYLEKTLASRTFLVGERITLADLFVTVALSFGFAKVLDAEFRATRPNTLRFFNTVINQANVAAVVGQPTLVEKAIVFTPPKKEEKKKEAPKEEKKPAAAPAPAAEEEEVAEAPKAKHPCESLPKPAFPLDDLKRAYSNMETVDAIKWLDEHWNDNDYSVWKASFKYPEELTQVFMSSNLVTGFHTRLEGSRKYIFGSMGVYGKANDSLITGVYIIRGHDAEACFSVAPDYESYNFEKLDYKLDKEFITGALTWEHTVDGKEYADGKVFK